MTSGDIRERLSTGGQGVLVMTAGTVAASLVGQVWLARERGPGGLGEYTATSLFVMVLSSVIFFGMPLAIAQRVAAVDELEPRLVRSAVDSALAASLAFALIASAIAFLLWPSFSTVLGLTSAGERWFAALATGAAIVHSFTVNVQLARLAVREAVVLTVIQPVAVIAGLAIGLVSAPFGSSSLALLGFTAAGIAATGVIARHGYHPRSETAEVKRLLRLALPATAVLHIQLLSQWVDRAIVAAVTGPFGLGAYAAASFLTEGALRAPRALGTFGVPAYARLSEDAVGARRVLASHIRVVSAFFIVVGVGFIAASAGLIIAIFGYDFYISVTALRLLSVALVPLGITLALASSDVGLGRESGEATALGLLVMQAILGLTFAAALSIAGVALASVVTWSVAAALFLWRSRAQLDAELRTAMLHVVGVAFPLWLVAWRLGVPPVPWPVGTVAAVALAALAASRWILTSADIRLLARLVPRIPRLGEA